MSRHLVLVRHAKAEPTHPRGDHDRVLTAGGLDDAAALGRWLLDEGLAPDLAHVSTGARAVQTLSALLGDRAEEVPTWSTRRIYDGGVDGVVAAVRESPEEAGTVWVVGHEPVMSTVAWEVADADRMADDLREELSQGFPTATAAVLKIDEPWQDVGFGSGRLVELHTGRAGE